MSINARISSNLPPECVQKNLIVTTASGQKQFLSRRRLDVYSFLLDFSQRPRRLHLYQTFRDFLAAFDPISTKTLFGSEVKHEVNVT